MPANFALATKFTAIDKVSGAFKNMSKNADKFGNRADKAFRKATRSGERFRDITKGILAAGAISRGVGLLERGVAAAASEFVNFDDSITAATARFKDVEAGTDQAAKTMQLLRKSARDAGKATQFSAAQAAQGLDFFARAGFTSVEAMGVLESQINLATATGEDFARVADISSDLLGAMGLNAQDSAAKIANLKKMNNLLAIATNSANVTMEDLFETIKIAGPIATAAGESQEKLIAMTAALGSAGIKGQMGATALKNAYIRLLDVTPEMARELASVGLATKDFVDQSGKMKSMTTIMETLGKRTAKLGQAGQLKFFATIFGKQAVAGGINLSKSLAEVGKTLKAMENSKAMQKIADQMRTSLGPRIKIIQSGLYEIAFRIFTHFEKRWKKALDVITDAIQNFDPAPIIMGIEKIIIAFKLMGSLITILKPLIAGVLAYKAALLVAALAQKSLTAASLIYMGFVKAQIFFTLAKSIGFAGTAMTLLNAAMAANPIGVIIAGVVALGTALYLVVKHWDDIVDAIKTAVDLSAKFLGFSDEAQTGPVGGAPVSSSRTEFVTPPNQADAEARAQQFNFMGRLDITGAPPGSTFEHTGKGAPRIGVELLGEN